MKTRYIIVSIVLIALLAAFSTPASATCPCVTIDTDTINGGIYYKTYDSFPGSGDVGNYIATHTFTNVPAGVKIARVHTGVWMLGCAYGPGIGDPGVEITVNGVASGVRHSDCDGYECNAINDPDMHDYVTGCDAHFITYDATADIPTGGGDVTVTVESTNADDGRLYTIALLVVYEDVGMASMTYWINEGAWFIGDGPGSVYFNGAYPPGVDDVTYWTLGMPNGIQTHPDLNGNPIGNPDYYEGGAYDFWRWDNINTGWLDPLSNLMYYAGPGGWERVDAAVFMLRRSPAELPDLIVEDIIFPDVMEPSTPYTVQATIKNQGNGQAGASSAELYVNTVLSGSASVPVLNAGASAPVSFTPQVSLAADCHEFEAVADSAGVITESDEYNNDKIEHYQVGNGVIVVRNNADLIAEADRVVGGTTYYIEDRTITNCAGCGITIENTTLPFVIDDCTVQNCGYDGGTTIASCSGICLKNVIDGEVRDSMVEHNTEHGVSTLDYSTQVDITNCTMRDHSAGYGVEIGLVTLTGGEIPDFINVKCCELYNNYYGIEAIGNDCTLKGNIVRDNSGYGIYVFGNDNELYNNTVENNNLDGIRLYNSTGNYVYWNDLTNNNGGGVQGWDNWATNTWRTATTVDYPYGCSIYNNYNGNYWDDYTGSGNGQGIGTTPYNIAGGTATDDYPLMVKWRLCGDVNCDGSTNFGDMGKVRRHKLFEEPLCNPWAGDVNCDGDINFGDMGKIRRHKLFEEPLNCCKDC